MDKFRINLAGFDFDDALLASLESMDIANLEITRKDDIWRKKTGKKYGVNIVRILRTTTCEEGFSPKIDSLIELLESHPEIKNVFLSCKNIELQIRIRIFVDKNHSIPSLGLTALQMEYLGSIGANVDVSIIASRGEVISY